MTQTIQKSKVTYTQSYEVPDSAMIDAIYYNDNAQLLFVGFLNGTVAGYRDVPVTIYEAFIDATSAGRFYNQNVRKNFRGVNGDVELVPQATAVADEPSPSGSRWNAPWSKARPAKDEPAAESPVSVEPTPAPTSEFIVTCIVRATSMNDAVNKIEQTLDATALSVERTQ